MDREHIGAAVLAFFAGVVSVSHVLSFKFSQPVLISAIGYRGRLPDPNPVALRT